MSNNRDSALWKRTVAGMIGGAAGTAAMDFYMKAIRKAAGGRKSPGQPKEHDVSLIGRKHQEGEPATAALGRLAYESIARREPDPETKTKLGEAVHWTYGVGQGALYGLVRGRAPKADLTGGLAYGAVLWLLGDEIALPLLGLAEGPKAYPAGLHAKAFGAHMVYGVATAATTQLAERVVGVRGRP